MRATDKPLIALPIKKGYPVILRKDQGGMAPVYDVVTVHRDETISVIRRFDLRAFRLPKSMFTRSGTTPTPASVVRHCEKVMKDGVEFSTDLLNKPKRKIAQVTVPKASAYYERKSTPDLRRLAMSHRLTEQTKQSIRRLLGARWVESLPYATRLPKMGEIILHDSDGNKPYAWEIVKVNKYGVRCIRVDAPGAAIVDEDETRTIKGNFTYYRR